MNLHILGYMASIQAKGISNTSFALQAQEQAILVDLSGSPCSSLLSAGIDPMSVQLVVLTHAHIDHIYALPSFIAELRILGREEPLTIVSTSETIAVAQALLGVFGLEEKEDIFPIHWLSFTEGELPFTVGGMQVILFPVEHSIPTLGMSVQYGERKLTYLADCRLADSYHPSIEGADILLHEATGGQAEEADLEQQGHSSARQAALLASEVKAKRLILVHLPPSSSEHAALLMEAQRHFANTTLPTLYEATVV